MRPLARPVLAATGLGAALGGGALAWGAGFERSWYILRHVTVPVLAPAARGPLRVLHVSDLHVLPGQQRLEAFLDQCRLAGADLVVATGDFLGSADSIDRAVDLLAGVRNGRPGLAVLGSNDLYGPRPRNPLAYLTSAARRRPPTALLDTRRLLAGLRGTGWEIMDNRRLQVETPVGRLDVTGLADPHIGRDRPEYLDWSPPGDGVALRLGLVHAPYLRSLDVFDREGIGLVLAGHTHGGQVRVPLLGALTANCDLPARQARGLSRHQRLWLHVSAGLGNGRYAPYRFACRPEATVLDLVPAPPS